PLLLMPCGPSAGPTGVAGDAAPASIGSLIRPETFFFGAILGSFSSSDNASHRSVGDGATTVARWSEHYKPEQSFRARSEVCIRLFDLGYFMETKGDRGFTFKDRYQDYELTRFDLDFRNRCGQGL